MFSNKLYSINILRFIAASFVLLSHIENKVYQYNILSLEWYRFRGPGVDIFLLRQVLLFRGFKSQVRHICS